MRNEKKKFNSDLILISEWPDQSWQRLITAQKLQLPERETENKSQKESEAQEALSV